jgi:hypothetical protein
VNVKAFFVDALSSALELNIATHDDVLRHVTPDVLAQHLPRPLWARLLAACLGAPRVDARLVVETIGVPNLCEHVPSHIIWASIADIAARALGTSRSVLAPPPEASAPTASASNAGPASVGPNIPAPTPSEPIGDLISELEQSDQPRGTPPRGRTAAPNRFRQSNTGVARGGLGSSRRPQAIATPPSATSLPRPGGRRGGTELTPDPEPETAVGDWRDKEIAVDDSQLVDWQTDIGASSAITGDDDFSDLGSRKR